MICPFHIRVLWVKIMPSLCQIAASLVLSVPKADWKKTSEEESFWDQYYKTYFAVMPLQ